MKNQLLVDIWCDLASVFYVHVFVSTLELRGHFESWFTETYVKMKWPSCNDYGCKMFLMLDLFLSQSKQSFACYGKINCENIEYCIEIRVLKVLMIF